MSISDHVYTIGLMSGTSLDGVDAVILENGPALKTRAHHSVPFPAQLKKQLTALCTPLPANTSVTIDLIDLLGDARRELTDLYATACSGLPSKELSKVVAIGAHGQTIRHRPDRAFSLQLIDGARLAEASKLPVVVDFRSADIAAGGQGAPLAPVFHQAMLRLDTPWRAIVNIGGIANVTVVSNNLEEILAGFDTGPGNRLLDDWSQLNLGWAFDEGGQWAASGKVNQKLLATLLDNDFINKPAPKSTGREDFSLRWLQTVLAQDALQDENLSAPDIQATLLELTVRSISDALAPYSVGQVLVCGGGAANTHLMSRLNAVHSGGCQSTTALGIDPQQVEAAAFAWLAHRRLANYPAGNPQTTGASGARILGALYPAPPTWQKPR